jgi:hypothetical protein
MTTSERILCTRQDVLSTETNIMPYLLTPSNRLCPVGSPPLDMLSPSAFRRPPQIPQRAAYTHSPQRHNRLPHRRRPRLFFTTTTLRDDDDHRTKHSLPRHHPALRHLPRRTRTGHASHSRPEVSHSNGVSRAYAGGRWHDIRREGTGRGGERAVRTAGQQRLEQKAAHGWIEDWVSVTGRSRHPIARETLT